MGALFTLLRDYAGLSQTRIGTATELGQGRVSEIVHGTRAIAATHVFERIANGLAMPDQARHHLGLSPRQPPPRTPPGTTRGRRRQDTDLLRQVTAARSIDPSVVRVLQGETDTIRLLDRRPCRPAPRPTPRGPPPPNR